MKQSHYILGITCLLGTLYHVSFFHLNEVLKVADSFAYLQMSHFLQTLSVEGLGSGWFGFFYSLPIALVNIFTQNDILSAQIVNIILINISALLLWNISNIVLERKYSLLVVILFFLSPTFLHFNIHILSENIYIPLFLGLFYTVYKFINTLPKPDNVLFFKEAKTVSIIAILIGLMYLTRAEAFIYLGSIGLLALGLVKIKQLSLKHFLGLSGVCIISFFIFISPYLFHLHSLTGEWGLTNKGASNLRQAELRGIDRMDDSGFERAVAELTEDKHHLIAGFAGGMKYDRPQIEGSLKEFILEDPKRFGKRVIENQKKIFSKNLPEIFLGKSPQLYFSQDVRFSNIFFLIFSIIPIGFLVYGGYRILRKEKLFFYTVLSFFLPAFFFFTLFFTLNRYFLIFLPLLLIIFVYGIRESHKYAKFAGIMSYLLILLLSTSVYYHIEAPKDEYYTLKKDAGIWLQQYIKKDNIPVKLMERFPIVTYYSGSKIRYITPYTDDIADIYEYGSFHDIDILVVDTMDFQTYRPLLAKYLESTPDSFELLRKFENKKGQKVILYTLKK